MFTNNIVIYTAVALNTLFLLCRNIEACCPPLHQQRDSQTPDCLTLVFPNRDWKCTMRSGRYLPAEGLEEQQWRPLLPIQEVGPSKPDEMA